MDFLTILLMNKLNVQLEIFVNTPPNKQTFIKHFYRNQMFYSYKLEENILKTLIYKTYSPLILITNILK